MGRTATALGSLVLLLGVFWAGRESTHGLRAFWEHWWCPIPVALVIAGMATVAIARRNPAAS